MSTPLYPPATWRLILSDPAPGVTNMAADEAIVRAVSGGLVPPTLRLYAWDPPCLSLGRAQAGDEVDRATCARDGVHVVRRPTGGRAILHTDELTYSVIAPLDDPRLSGDIVASYRRLSRALLAALQRVGIDAESKAAGQESRSTPRTSRDANPVCFEVPSHYELTADDGRKLVGSAQMRTSDAVLQHGTIPLVGDIARICHYLKDPPASDRVRARAATLESALGRPVTWEQVAKAMIAGFASALNLTLDEAGLTPKEQDWVTEICADKYGSDAWTWRA